MGFKDILNYPLLRGERAERLSRQVIENPALAIAAATATLTSLAVVGPWFTLGLAAFWSLQVDRFIRDGIKAGIRKLKRAPVFEPHASTLWNRKYDNAAGRVREFVWQHALPDTKMNIHLSPQGDSLGTASVRPGEATISVKFSRLCEGNVAPKDAGQRAEFIAAHELGHLQDVSYTRLVTGHVAPRLAISAAVLAFGVAALGVVGGAAVMPLLAPVAMAGLGALGTVLATTLAQRQEEYRADRHAIRLTRNPQAGRDVLLIKQKDSRYNMAAGPSLLINCLMSHPCMANRSREMDCYNAELPVKRQKTPNML